MKMTINDTEFEACRKIRDEDLENALLPTGEAVITKGYDLPAACVIHTVGPVWKNNTTNEEEMLASCFVDGHIKLPKLKWMKIKQHREIPDDHHIKSCTITKTKTGKYDVSVLTEYEKEIKSKAIEQVVG